MRYFSSIVLEVMRRAQEKLPLTLKEIADAVETLIIDENIPRGEHRWFLRSDRSPEWRLFTVKQALLDAEGLGLVRSIHNASDRDEKERWRIADTWQPPEYSDLVGGGGAGGSANQRGGDNNDGGGGLAEALSHPVLFSLDEDDFEALVEDIFEGGRS